MSASLFRPTFQPTFPTDHRFVDSRTAAAKTHLEWGAWAVFERLLSPEVDVRDPRTGRPSPLLSNRMAKLFRLEDTASISLRLQVQ